MTGHAGLGRIGSFLSLFGMRFEAQSLVSLVLRLWPKFVLAMIGSRECTKR